MEITSYSITNGKWHTRVHVMFIRTGWLIYKYTSVYIIMWMMILLSTALLQWGNNHYHYHATCTCMITSLREWCNYSLYNIPYIIIISINHILKEWYTYTLYSICTHIIPSLREYVHWLTYISVPGCSGSECIERRVLTKRIQLTSVEDNRIFWRGNNQYGTPNVHVHVYIVHATM